MDNETGANGTEAGGKDAQNVSEATEPQTIALEEHNRILAEYRAAAKAELDAKDATYGPEAERWGQDKKKMRAEIAHWKALAEEATLPEDRQAIAQRRLEQDAREEELKEGHAALQRQRIEFAADTAVNKLKSRFPGLPEHFYVQARTRMMRGPLETQDVMQEAEGMFKALTANTSKSEGAEKKVPMPTDVPKGSGGSGFNAYQQTLRSGEKLPPSADIDAATAEFLRGHKG